MPVHVVLSFAFKQVHKQNILYALPFTCLSYALPFKMHCLIAIKQMLCHDVTGLDMSNLAAMFGAGEALGEFAGGTPPVQDPETAYASQLTQLQARCSHHDSVLHCETCSWHPSGYCMHTYASICLQCCTRQQSTVCK